MSAAISFVPEDILAKIYLFRVHTYHEQIAVCYKLRQFCLEHPQVRLLVIDSIAFHFRQEFSNMALRTRLLHGMAQTLTQLALEFNVGVVLMNQLTTKFNKSDGCRAQLVPALGESWGHACTNRIILSWQQNHR